ncbi:Uncharacterised protein [Mycobacteroides abscessus subsp. abscessus]|nr:Uncharacterised protein [Mycobacteroides abscessus subsp. abscessus]
MRNGERSVNADLVQVGRERPVVVVICGALAQVGKERLPGPFLAAVLSPPIVGRLATGDPAEVVAGRAAAEGPTTSAVLVGAPPDAAVNERGAVVPVILGVADVHGQPRGADQLNIPRITDAGFDNENFDIGVFGESTGDDIASRPTANNNEVKVRSIVGHEFLL